MTQFDEKCKNCGKENIDHFVDNGELHCYIGSNYPRFEVDPTPTPSGAKCDRCGKLASEHECAYAYIHCQGKAEPAQPAGTQAEMDSINVCTDHELRKSDKEHCYICFLDAQKHGKPSPATETAREWLEKSEYQIFLTGYTGVSGKLLIEVLESYHAAQSAADWQQLVTAQDDMNKLLATRDADIAALRAERDDLRAFNQSLHGLCQRVWQALEPTGEYEGDENLVQFAKSVRVAKDSAEWSLSSIVPERDALLAERDEALRKLEELKQSRMFQRIGELAQAKEAAERQVAELREALEVADSTLCECRHATYTPALEDCNCDIHAAHKIIQAALAQAKKEKA